MLGEECLFRVSLCYRDSTLVLSHKETRRGKLWPEELSPSLSPKPPSQQVGIGHIGFIQDSLLTPPPALRVLYHTNVPRFNPPVEARKRKTVPRTGFIDSNGSTF